MPDLRCADLTNATFDGVTLSQRSLVGAHAQGASFRDANLVQADLSGADLRGANFDHAELDQATLIGIDGRATPSRNATPFRHAAMVQADLSP